MSPVADMNLNTYLEGPARSRPAELRTFFGCLARALEFLHEHGILHENIKSSNVLVNRGNVLLTDCGLSFDFEDAAGSTTTSMVYRRTLRCKVLGKTMNSRSDIWSLGVVFLEMTVVLKGLTIEDMNRFLLAKGMKSDRAHANYGAVFDFIAELKQTAKSADNIVLEWVKEMLHLEPPSRPTATKLVASSINAAEREEATSTFCGICCSLPDDNDERDFRLGE
ncbi:kinase-like domain-containing protein [Hypomontagnella submonticulosa]|nr:kinase-like domain-containing protein [Hypomontagnella submonticulosa]